MMRMRGTTNHTLFLDEAARIERGRKVLVGRWAMANQTWLTNVRMVGLGFWNAVTREHVIV